MSSTNRLITNPNSKRLLLFLMLLIGTLITLAPGHLSAQCTGTKTADVVALNQPFFYNRLGASNPAGMIFALKRDVVPINPGTPLASGNVRLRDGKRPRPIVLRMNVNDCLTINFTNLLNSVPLAVDEPATRSASIHVMGMQLVGSIASDGSNVGTNVSSLVFPGGSATYTFAAQKEGTFLLYSAGATTSGEGDGGTLSAGLFGAVNVEPAGAEYYRSQITAADLALASNGTTPDAHPKINYSAVYPAGHPRAGLPILKMTLGNEIVHSDLNAMITGPNAGRFPTGTYRVNAIYPDRDQPFREFTVIFHDEIIAHQAFFDDFILDPVLSNTLHSVRDGFAINYGSAGVGAEIFANRIGLGPMKGCTECKFEEFFLSSWAVGDPAMVVDIPANGSDPAAGIVATQAFYPDDPSNVHHSYISDHVKFRNLHAGPKEHHIFHLHTHQWLHTPDSDNSAYLDSQAIGPGQGWTYEITYNGSGNRNKIVGDAIFHCHFYPHFAQGMWELWRSHDVFEAGTVLDASGRPAPGARALPDGEIAVGTPIPALVPLPTLPMAPLPGATVSIQNGQVVVNGSGNPGYPFFAAAAYDGAGHLVSPGAVAGHRPPHPPLDTIDDGGLPRHIITGGTADHAETRLDFHKKLLTAAAISVPEDGSPLEKIAMAYHGVRLHPSYNPDGTPGNFVTNGLPPQHGAPFADPCEDDTGKAVGVPRIYRAAAIQLDIKFNKEGWHFPQSRILTLWGDVASTLAGIRPPEPFFFRANTNDCITYYHTNLVPNEYQQDDFQVRTPTDVIGQHIHLVKFDVTASDGSGNGFNYEDGTFSPDEVVERITAINAAGGLETVGGGGAKVMLSAKPHPYFGTPGAQTTVQRWYADNTLNNAGQDRTLRTVFTHDHFGPSTHQQAGLYAGLVVEPQGSTWRNPETGVMLGSGFDGGPTSWRADILTANQADTYREFMFEFADYQLAYTSEGKAVNPPVRDEDPIYGLIPAAGCPGPAAPPCPEAISAADVGTMTVNYRNEPIPLRVRDPLSNTQASGVAGDLSHVFSSKITRKDPALNTQPNFYPPLTGGVLPTDPFTPLLRAYEEDSVHIRVMVGATEESHNFSMNGIKWLFEPSDPNSGYRNSQMAGISEHFEFITHRLDSAGNRPFIDYLYKTGSSVDDLWNGMWGLMRVYDRQAAPQTDLLPLPNNLSGHTPTNSNTVTKGICPSAAPTRSFAATAITAQQALGGPLVYNPRITNTGQLSDPTAILYVRSADLDSNGRLKPGVPIEPLVLRAAAGDCIELTLTNRLPAVLPDVNGFNTMPPIVDFFNANQLIPSSDVGLHPQLVTYSMTTGDDGTDVGMNTPGVVPPGSTVLYRWYAGQVTVKNGKRDATAIEYGATNLISSDPIKHSNKGAIGALIIEPQWSTWVEDANSRASATVTPWKGPAFRDFALLIQDDLNLRYNGGTDLNSTVQLLAEAEDPEDSGHKAFNYRTEPLWKRMGFLPETALTDTRTFDFTNVLSNSQVGGDPVTPVFTATAGMQVRFHVLEPGGHSRNHVFQIHGHGWEEEPFTNSSTVIGDNPLSAYLGSQMGIGPSDHHTFVISNAGGKFGVRGDYLFRDQQSFMFDGGLWGIFRVK
ncbi:MAG: multicopper oxidase domain-containing protein [Acidobacteriia bacterium]|nr:multicopper oxidase domain-containing protein [Terriglobia bacterium]